MIYMDTDVELEYPHMAKACAESPYSIEELKEILFKEVFPACRSNFYYPVAPEWSGYEINWLTDRILKKHRHGKRFPLIIFHSMTTQCWNKLKANIITLRSGEQVD